MDLENKVHNKTNILKKISKKIMPYVLAAGLGLSIMSCQDPGPISVQNTVSPTIAPSGGDVYWKVKVTNDGGKVTIDQARFRERVISGWAVGLYDISGNLPITDNEISAYSTETLFSMYAPVLNTGPNNITFENTVTVTSDGGEDSDTCTYIVTPSGKSLSGKELSKAVGGVVKALSDYMK